MTVTIRFKQLFVSPYFLEKHWIWKKNPLIFLLRVTGIFLNIHTNTVVTVGKFSPGSFGTRHSRTSTAEYKFRMWKSSFFKL